MRLLENIILETNNGIEVIQAGAILKEQSDTLDDVDLDAIQTQPQYSTKQLADMVERWISKNRSYVDKGQITEQQWEYVTEELLILIKMLYDGDKEGIVRHIQALKNHQVDNPKQQKLKNVIMKVYNNIASKLGTYEFHGGRILNRESFIHIKNYIIEAITAFDNIING